MLADSDTRWKWGSLTAKRLTGAAEGDGAAPDLRLDGYLLRGRATPTPRQLEEVGVRADSMREVTAIEFLNAVASGRDEEAPEAPDVIVLALVGGAVQAVLHGLARVFAGAARRPVVVTGYVGVVYEKLADGLLLRHGADVVLANSRQDAERFRAVYEGVGADASGVVEAALPFLGGEPYAPRDPYTVVFAAQPSVPEKRADRAYLLSRLIQHARRHPEREVLLKLRSKPGEHTTHIEELPYQKLVRGEEQPANFRLVYGHMGEVLDRTDLLVTVSSTAATSPSSRTCASPPPVRGLNWWAPRRDLSLAAYEGRPLHVLHLGGQHHVVGLPRDLRFHLGDEIQRRDTLRLIFPVAKKSQAVDRRPDEAPRSRAHTHVPPWKRGGRAQ